MYLYVIFKVILEQIAHVHITLSLNMQSTFPKNKTILHTTLVQVQNSYYLIGFNLNTINL